MKRSDLSKLTANANRVARRLKLLSHPERLVMLCKLDDTEASVNELVALTDLSQSSVSQHLAMLRDEGVVTARNEAQARYYRLTDPEMRQIIHAVCEICAAPTTTEATSG